MRRFEGRWAKWDAAVHAGEKPHVFLPRVSYESLVDLMASGDPVSRRYELNLIATEMHNRVARLRILMEDVAEAANRCIDDALVTTAQAARAARRSEANIKRHIEVRQDQVEQEPQAAEDASLAAERAEEALQEAVVVKRRLNDLDAATRADSRDAWRDRNAANGEA